MHQVRIRARWPILNLAVGAETTLPRSALVDALIDRGYLVLVDQHLPEPENDPEPDETSTDHRTTSARRPRSGRSK